MIEQKTGFGLHLRADLAHQFHELTRAARKNSGTGQYEQKQRAAQQPVFRCRIEQQPDQQIHGSIKKIRPLLSAFGVCGVLDNTEKLPPQKTKRPDKLGQLLAASQRGWAILIAPIFLWSVICSKLNRR